MTSAAHTPGETALHYRVVHPALGVRGVRQESVAAPGDGGPWIVCAVQEVTDREGVEDTIRKLAYFDPLTDLPNRSFLNEYLRSVVVHARRHDRTAAILHVDLDSFKRINDTLGHSAGDRLLQEVAVRLQSCVRDSDCVAREHGGEVWPGQASLDAVTRFAADEFIVVLSEVAQQGDPERVAQRILGRLREPMNLDGREVTMGASIGIAAYPDDAEDEDALLRNSALAHAQRQAARPQQPSALLPDAGGPRGGPPEHGGEAAPGAGHRWPEPALPAEGGGGEPPAERAPRRCCAGSTRNSAWCRPRSSSPSPRRRGSSCPWASG